MSLASIYNEQITYHSKHPRNYGEMDSPDKVVEGKNPLCGDSFTFYLRFDESQKVKEVTFTGKGCAISMASASMMTKVAKGKTEAEVALLFDEFKQMATGKLDVDTHPNQLGHLTVFKGVKEFPVRIKCATLPWHTLQSAFKGKETATTE